MHIYICIFIFIYINNMQTYTCVCVYVYETLPLIVLVFKNVDLTHIIESGLVKWRMQLHFLSVFQIL